MTVTSVVHYTNRKGWLRAAVLGAHDGIISTSSLLLGVVAAGVSISEVLITGIAGAVAGALSMAAGEYVSVSAQADTERADLQREEQELDDNPEFEHQELTQIYIERGLSPTLAREVSTQLMNHNALATHAREELGITDLSVARPRLAAFVSASMFSAGAFLPILALVVAPPAHIIFAIATSTIISLGFLGVVTAYLGGTDTLKSMKRLLFWGIFAMAATAAVGRVIV